MTCRSCGTLNVESAAVCAACGASLAGETPSRTLAAPNLPNKPLVATRGGKPVVGGWLLLFCIGLTFIGPLGALAKALGTTYPFARFYDLGLATLSVFVGVNLWAVKPRALLLLNLYFLVELVTGAGASVIVLYAWLLHPHSAQINNVLGNQTEYVLLTVTSVGSMWWYFKVSRRVRATFGSNL